MNTSISSISSVGATPTQAIEDVERSIRTAGNPKDLAYFLQHKSRFERTLRRLVDLVPNRGARMLDIGSHYLHLSAALRRLGYRVTAMDVSAFSNESLIQQRAAEYDIDILVVDNFEDGMFLLGEREVIDVVVFTEILEHITFNPIQFWHRTYQLLRPDGVIYITTPNSLTPWKILHAFKRLLKLEGLGLTAPEILLTVSYGHHWKEYSAHEIQDYFRRLSPDFSLQLNYYNNPRKDDQRDSLKTVVRELVHRAASAVPHFRDEIEVIVSVSRKSAWLLEPPVFL